MARKALKKEKDQPVSIFEDAKESFDKPFTPIIRVRAVKNGSTKRINFILGNLLFLIVLFVFFSILYIASIQGFYKNLFFILTLIFGGISIAFLISLLSLVFLQILNE